MGGFQNEYVDFDTLIDYLKLFKLELVFSFKACSLVSHELALIN
jgi:hypothetical protein